MSDLALNLPINGLSFGQVSFGILQALYKKDPTKVYPIFPIGNQADLAAYKVDQGFGEWLQKGIQASLLTHSRKNPTIKLWHINQSLESLSEKQTLLTFHETGQVTFHEANILKNQDKVVVTSKYTKQVFEDHGVKNVVYTPLGFDSVHFFDTKKKYFQDGRIVFNLLGKAEIFRKHTFKTLAAWAKKFGNNSKYHLNVAVHNPWMKPEVLNQLIGQALNGVKFWNINFLPYLKTNLEYNDLLNSAQICLGMQGLEGYNLPLWHSIGLGKLGVVLDAHVHKDYCNAENSVLVSPNGKVPIYDGIHFHPNQPFNQGEVYSFSDDDFISGCEEAIKRVENNPVNEAGKKLQEVTYAQTLENILEEIK